MTTPSIALSRIRPRRHGRMMCMGSEWLLTLPEAEKLAQDLLDIHQYRGGYWGPWWVLISQRFDGRDCVRLTTRGGISVLLRDDGERSDALELASLILRETRGAEVAR